MRKLLLPHSEVLRKLKTLAKCRTRKQLDALNVDRAQLRALLDGLTQIDRHGHEVLMRVRDADFAVMFGISRQRWSYVKACLLNAR